MAKKSEDDSLHIDVVENTSLFGIYSVDIDSYEIKYANKYVQDIMVEPSNTKCWKALYGLDSVCPWCKIAELKERESNHEGKVLSSEFFNKTNNTWYKIDEELIELNNHNTIKNAVMLDISSQKVEHNKLQDLVVRDPLTSLYNRRHLNGIQKELFLLAKRKGSDLSVLMLDIDFFKKINDTYGHPCGDTVIKLFAKILIENTRDSDFVYRIGGEEFVVILHDANSENAERIAEKIREIIESSEVEDEKSNKFNFTTSIGVSCYNSKSDSLFNDILTRADEALYSAKNSGRNKVVVLKVV